MLYYILYPIMYLISLIPFKVMYFISDILFVLVYHVVGYRKKLVRKNMRDSFPEKSEKEIVDIEKKFYHWFCDYIFETVKMMSISQEDMRKHMQIDNIEEANKILDSGRNISLFLGHYCNWEWASSIGLHTSHHCAHIYHPLENKAMNKIFFDFRARFNSQNLAMNETPRTLITWKRANKVNMVGYISDQAPGYNQMFCFVNFLNHKDTPVFSGAERMAQLTDAAVFYFRISRPRRGYYHAEFMKIVDSTKDFPVHYPTIQYFKLLEEDIRLNPQYWLWTHNRWKRTIEEYNKIYSEEERKLRATKA